MNNGGTTAVGSWASLPLDLLLEIFRRLESTAVTRCAGACRPWRHAIVGNASILRPRLDRSVPNLLLGVFHGPGNRNHSRLYLRPFQSTLPSTGAAAGSKSRIRIQSLIPATGAAGFDPEMFTDLLSSRDGFILLKGKHCSLLCLCNPMTGACKILPDATIKNSCTYVLLTGYDDDDDLSVRKGISNDHDLQAVRVLAIAVRKTEYETTMCTEENRITYQVFSFGSGAGDDGAWGPVNRSVELLNTATKVRVPVYGDRPGTVVAGGAVYWLGGYTPRITCVVGLDVRTGRAWVTELAEATKIAGANMLTPTLLATSGDGQRLSLIRSPFPRTTGHAGQQIQVWVLMGEGDDQWSLEKTIDVPVHKLLPDYRPEYFKEKPVILSAFCPRSGSVIGDFAGQEIRIVLEGRSDDTCLELIAAREGFVTRTRWIGRLTFQR